MMDTIASALWLTALVGFCIHIASLDIKANRARRKHMRKLEERVADLEADVYPRKD